MTGREGSNIMHTGIDSLQSIFGTQSEGTDVEGVLGH